MPKLNVFFEKMVDGSKAVRVLKEKGYKNAHLDMTKGFMEEYAEEINFAGSRNAPSLSGLVLKSDGHILNIDKAPLVASSPLVSGTSSGLETSTRLIVTVDEEMVDNVKSLVRELGGNVQS